MNDKVSWGKGDIGSKIYGIYENKIQQKLKDISKPILIDIGAADGFFAIGCLKSKICEFCYAFEETKKSRENLHLTAKINNVKNKLSIMGEVTKDNFLSLLPLEIDFSKTTILCDIEGGEFDFFTKSSFVWAQCGVVWCGVDSLIFVKVPLCVGFAVWCGEFDFF